MVDEREEKMKALANDILEQCQKQGLTFSEMRTLSTMLHVKWDEARDRAMEKAGDYRFTAELF